MATETVENYLKAILTLSEQSESGEVGLAMLADTIGVTRGTATSMVKRLSAARLAKAERYGAITLTPKGRRAALDVVRRHRLIETFLVQMLKLDWSDVHDEAERLEHAVSPRLLDRIDEFLGRPVVDPHGDPIPKPDGRLRALSDKPLSQCAAGAKVRIARITVQDPDFLRFVARHGLKPGSRAVVLSVDPQADALLIEPHGGRAVSLSQSAAAKICVDH